MRHLTVTEYGQFLGITGSRLVVKQDNSVICELPLSRLRTISVAKNGVSFSSNLLMNCALRGIGFYLLDWRGMSVAALLGVQQHATCGVRKAQFQFLEGLTVADQAAHFIHGKVRNQRAVLRYFSKYQKKTSPEIAEGLKARALQLQNISESLSPKHEFSQIEDWRGRILGLEGASAAIYWQALRDSRLLPESFIHRIGRGAEDVCNQALNFAYTLLLSYVWQSLNNAGLEVYAGVLHTQRPGKPSLVLDMMEEYRPWVADRTVIKLRSQLEDSNQLTPSLKKQLSAGVHQTFATRYLYHSRKIRLDSILQRQCYRLAGVFAEQKRYRPYRFKW
jgi:CRISP-associated protein Cas1